MKLFDPIRSLAYFFIWVRMVSIYVRHQPELEPFVPIRPARKQSISVDTIFADRLAQKATYINEIEYNRHQLESIYRKCSH